jgi:hypothetical protein
MTLNISFQPAVGYSGNYVAVAYDALFPNTPIGQTTFTGPFGSTVSGTITGVPDVPDYIVKYFSNDCQDAVAQQTISH